MPTLIDVAKQFKQCDNATVQNIYTIILLRLRKIQEQIQKHEDEFPAFVIKENPVASMITLAKTEIDALQRLPESCFKIKTQALDLSARLAQYRDCIGTAFCKNAHNAYDWLAKNIVAAIMKEIRRDINDTNLRAELNNKFTQFYAELIQNSARTQPQEISEKQEQYVEVPRPKKRAA